MRGPDGRFVAGEPHPRSRAWEHSPAGLAYNNHPRNKRRVLAQVKAVFTQPRCVICSNPIRHGAVGVRLKSATCGNRACAKKRWAWVHPRKP